MISMANGGVLGDSSRMSSRYGANSTLRSTAMSVGPTPTGSRPVVQAASASGAASAANDTPSPVTVLIGLIGLLLLMKIVGEMENTAITPAHISIGGYNLIAITVTAVVGISIGKLIFTRWRVPGVSALFKFV